MLFSAEWEKFIWEGLIFLTYFLICGALTERRFSKTVSLLTAGGTVAVIVSLQTALFLFVQDKTMILTWLPLTAYLPVIVCLHILSRSGFYQTMAIWTLGTVVYFILKVFWKILMHFWGSIMSLPGWGCSLLVTACLLLLTGLILFLVFRFLRRPFQMYVLRNQTNWLLLSFPVLMLFLLFSYFCSSTTDSLLLILLLLTACSVFLVLICVLASSATLARMKESEKAVAFQMQMQRREYEDTRHKMELGRTFRHDMRHHLLALKSLAEQGDTKSITQYIHGLNGQLTEIEKETYCENTTINAVLSACIGRAKEAHCDVTVIMRLPAKLLFDEIDICTVLANALENAVNACQKLCIEKRCIHFAAELADESKLTIAIENPCDTPLSFDADGYPIVPERKNHGIGLKSIDAITRKYNGMFSCKYRDGMFLFKAVMFSAQKPDTDSNEGGRGKHHPFQKSVFSALLFLLTFSFFVNCMPATAQALKEVPILGALVRIADLRTYHFRWGATSFYAALPVLEMEIPKSALNAESTEFAFSNEKVSSDKDTRSDSVISKEQSDTVSQSADSAALPQPPAVETYPSQFAESSPVLGMEIPRPAVNAESTESVSSDETVSSETGTEALADPVISKEESDTRYQPEDSVTTQPPAEESAPSQSAAESRPVSPIVPDEPSTPASGVFEGAEELNRQIEGYIAEMCEKFLWYVARKYEGYVGADTGYQILCDNDNIFVIRFYTTLNVGGSAQYSRSFTLDKRTGEVLELSDLFLLDSNYVGVISKEILRQMKEQVDAGKGDYFIPGGIWSEDECFKEIDTDQDFYINGQNQLVIVFEEYKVAPGNMGIPEFVLPSECVREILQQPSLIS